MCITPSHYNLPQGCVPPLIMPSCNCCLFSLRLSFSCITFACLSYKQNSDINFPFLVSSDYRQPKLSVRVKSLMHVVSYCIILKMAVNIKDLYRNSGKKFEKVNTC